MNVVKQVSGILALCFFATNLYASPVPEAKISEIRSELEQSGHERAELAAKALGDEDFLKFLRDLFSEPDPDLKIQKILEKISE